MKKMCNKIFGLFLTLLISVNGFSQYNNAFRFKITGNGYTDETVVRLLNGATQNYDGMYDAWKIFSLNPNVPSIYTQIAAGQELSINSLPEFTEDVSINIYTSTPVSGTYTINIEEIYALTSNYKVSLTDISSNTHYRILGDTALVFTINAQQNSPTFTFNISTPAVISTTNESCNNMNDGSLLVNNAGNTNWEIAIFDATNNLVVNGTSNSSLNSYSNLSPGNYTAELNSMGITDELNFTINAAPVLTADFNLNKDTIYISEGGNLDVTNISQNAQNYTWNFGDGGSSADVNPSYTYSATGQYDITLTSYNGDCTVQNTKQINVFLTPSVITGINDMTDNDMKILNLGNGQYRVSTNNFSTKSINVYDLKGSLIVTATSAEKDNDISLMNYTSGLYILTVAFADGKVYREKLFR